MKKPTFILILLAISSFQLLAQKTGLEQAEARLKVWQESKPAYDKFIKKQAKIRARLDKVIEAEDLANLEILKNAYAIKMQKMEERAKLVPTISKGNTEQTQVFIDLYSILNHRYKHMVGSYSEMVLPMLQSNRTLYGTAEILAVKYNSQILKVDKKIKKHYKKFKKAERKIALKYSEKVNNLDKKEATKVKEKVPKNADKVNVYQNAKILMTDSKI